MSARHLSRSRRNAIVLAFVAAVAILATTVPVDAENDGNGGYQSAPTSSGGTAGATYWMVAQTGGGVTRPHGATSCEHWTLVPGSMFGTTGSHEIRDGIAYDLYRRTCSDGSAQYVWVPDLPPRVVAQTAIDTVRRQIHTPAPVFFPGAEMNVVNAPTRFGATPQPIQTATVSVPGLAVTVTATPTLLTLDTGSIVDGDTTHVECTPWGAAGIDDDSACQWTPTWPSVARTTGTDDHHYHATISLTWAITWASTDGTTGTLDDITVTTPVDLAVREIQTIGGT